MDSQTDREGKQESREQRTPPPLRFMKLPKMTGAEENRLIFSLAGIGITLFIFFSGIIWCLDSMVKPPQHPTPRAGYAGEWRPWNSDPVEERPLPPAASLWTDYQSWAAESSKESVARLYLARMGHASRQKDFKVSQQMTSGMPLGDYTYTTVEFNYHDPSNGVYHLTWSLPGKHSPDFLRFDDTERQFLLQAAGPEDYPILSIQGVEGTKPFWGSPRQPR